MKHPKKPRQERRRFADLVSYPRQAEFFDPLPAQDLEELGRAMRKGGVPPIEILPDNRAGLKPNTILRGHGRREAAEQSGLVEVETLVRYDLAHATPEAIEREFLVDNVHRRHLDPLAKARAALQIYRLTEGRKGKLSASQEAAARARIAKTLGWSDRHLSRLWRVLGAAVEVQNAAREGRLPLLLAERVAGLGQDVQAEIAKRIQLGEDPKVVAGTYLPAEEDRPWGGGDAVVGVLRALRSFRRCARGPQDHFRPDRLTKHIDILNEAQGVLANLIARATLGAGQGENVHSLGGGEE